MSKEKGGALTTIGQQVQLQQQQENDSSIEPFKNNFDVSGLIATASTLKTTSEQREILYAPVNEEDIEIREDGIIYLPWMEYVTRLNRAFGTEWCLIPQGMPMFKNNYIYWGFWLVIKGVYCGYAIGEQQYFPNSRSGKQFMTYGDACEGAKSNALMRLCKGLGIGLEMWKPSFIRQWKKKYAVKGKDGKWYRKDYIEDDTPESKPKPKSQPRQEKPQEQTKKDEKNKPNDEFYRFLKKMQELKKQLGEEKYYEILGNFGYEKSNQVTNLEEQIKIVNYMQQIIEE